MKIKCKEYEDWRFYHDYAVKFTCAGCKKEDKNCENCDVLKDEKELYNLIPDDIKKKIEKGEKISC